MEFGEDEEPTGWAGPIAKDLGQGVQGLASDLAERLKRDGLLPEFEFTRAYLGLYAVMYGLGVVIAVLATMIASVKIAAARGVDSRIMAQQALIRLLAFSAVGALAPLLLAVVGDLAQTLAGGFFDMAADQLAGKLSWLAGALAVGTLASLVVPGGSAVMVGLFLFLLGCLAGILLELMISHFLIFLLGLLVPILYAASINPDWRGGVRKVSGALLGAFLAPAALFVVWVVTFAAVPPWASDGSFFTKAGMLIVGLLLSLAAPVAIGMLLAHVVPVFAGTGNGYQTGVLASTLDRVKPRTGREPSASPRGSRSKRASEVTDTAADTPVESPTTTRRDGSVSSTPAPGGPGAGAETAGPGAAGSGASGAGASGSGAAGSAGGPVAAAAAAWMRLVGKARRTAEWTRDKLAGGTRRAADQPDADRSDPDQPSAGGVSDGRRGREPAGPRPATDEPASAGEGSDGSRGSRPAGPETSAVSGKTSAISRAAGSGRGDGSGERNAARTLGEGRR